MKFRKKPVVVEAEQYFPDQHVQGVCASFHKGSEGRICPDEIDTPHIHTLEGPLHVSPGDWIITGVKGEKYPCKPDIFEQTYDLA